MDLPPPLPPALPTNKQTWWDRNWKWVAIGGSMIFLALCAFGTWTAMSWIGDRMKRTEAYQRALPIVLSDAEVVAALGSPIEPRGFLSGHLSENDRYASLIMSQLLVGPKAQGRLTIVAFKSEDRWTYERLEVLPEGHAEAIAVKMPAVQKSGAAESAAPLE